MLLAVINLDAKDVRISSHAQPVRPPLTPSLPFHDDS